MQQRYPSFAIASMLLICCSGSSVYAGTASVRPSVSAKSSLTASAPPTFFNKPELDPSLAADTRLDRKITLDEIGVSLSDILQKVSAADMPLTSGAECADRKLQVRLQDRSLRSVMAALAQLTPGTWKREGKGYCLYADPKATEYENHWWQLYGLERERVLAALRTEILTAMQRKPYIYKDGDPNPENMPQEMFDRMAQDQEFWNLLPEPLQKQVADQIVDSAYYHANLSHVSRPIEGAVVVSFQSIPAQAQVDALASARQLLNGNKMGSPAFLSFNNIGFTVAPRIRTTEGQWRDIPADLLVDIRPLTPTLTLNHARLPEKMKKLGDQAPATWKPLAEYQEQHVWPNDPSVRNPDLHPNSFPNYPPRQVEVLDWLADKAGIEFVADYYSVASEPLSLAVKKNRLTQPLKQELDYRAVQEDMSWKQRTDGLYLFRNNRWYRDDRLEVPNGTIQGLLKTLRAAETPSQPTPPTQIDSATEPTVPENPLQTQLDLANSIVAQLTPWQIANGLPNYTIEPSRDPAKADTMPAKLHKATITMNGKTRTFFFFTPTSTARPFDQIADIILDDYHTYLFHSGLSPLQADALLADGLPVSALNDVQASQAAYLLPELQLASPNQPLLLRLRPEPGFDQVQLGPVGSPAAALPLQRLRLTVPASNNAPSGDSASP